MRYLKHSHYNPFNLCKRFVYHDTPRPSPQKIAEETSAKEMQNVIPPGVKLDEAELSRLQKTFDESGKKAAELAAQKKAAQNGSVEDLRTAAQEAYLTAAKKVVDEELEIRSRQNRINFMKAAVVVGTVGGEVVPPLVIIPPLVTAGPVVGGIAALGTMPLLFVSSVAVASIGAAAYQGVKLYEDIARTGWTTGSKETDKAIKTAVAPYNPQNITEAGNRGKSDLQAAIESKGGNACRGAALLGRNTASDLLVEVASYGKKGSVNTEISGPKIKVMIAYARDVLAQIDKQLLTLGAVPPPLIHNEAEKSYEALTYAIITAKQLFRETSDPDYKDPKAKEQLEAARKITGEIDGQRK